LSGQASRWPEAHVARLATVGPDGRPHVVPSCFAVDGDTLYTAVDEKPKRTRELQRLRNIRAHPQVEVVVDHYEEDWSRLWWARLQGRARVAELDEWVRELLAAKYPQYRSQPPAGPLVVVEIERVVEWAAEPD
jgi:PPOX class probable F420-dependent enzyme